MTNTEDLLRMREIISLGNKLVLFWQSGREKIECSGGRVKVRCDTVDELRKWGQFPFARRLREGKPAKASGSDGFCNPPNLVLCQIGHLCCQASSGENFRDKFHGLALFLAPDYTPVHLTKEM